MNRRIPSVIRPSVPQGVVKPDTQFQARQQADMQSRWTRAIRATSPNKGN